MKTLAGKYTFVTEAPNKVVVLPTFLRDDFGADVLKAYNEIVETEYNNNQNLKVLELSNGVVRGSNSFAVPIINRIVGEAGLRVATQADLEKILRARSLDLCGSYEDTSLVLRSLGSPNEYLAKDLAEQIRVRNGGKLKLPVMVPLASLDVVNDEVSQYGLSFNLKDSAQIV